MDRVRTLLVDAFTDAPLSGNAAGIVPDADDLSAIQMQAIARELAVSETAFLGASDVADRRVRYFTPTTEVDLCGHATIASHVHLFADGVIEAGTHTLETNVDVLDIDVESDGTVWMTQDAPEIHELDVDTARVGEALGIDPADFALDDLPFASSSTGLAFLIVPVTWFTALRDADPKMAAIEALSDELDVTGVYAFTFDTIDADATLHGRMFAPLAGVPEDPVTGTASGAVGAYLRRFGAFESIPDEMTFEQGHLIDRPGRVHVRVDETVRVGGRAVTALEGELCVPESDPDDVIVG